MTTNPPPVQPQAPTKSITGGFELQTKIRVIIQQVLAATVRKLSHFGDKIDKFQEYFITFRQRFETAERERVRQQEEMAKIEETNMSIRRDMNFNEIKYGEEKERAAILSKEHRDQYSDLQRMVKGLVRQNQNVNSQLSKTKSKFLEYSNIISTLKEEVSWKITKYLQETAESHTQMKVFAQKIKNQYFNITLMVEKQKQKYEQIILKNQEDVQFKQDVTSKFEEMIRDNLNKIQEIKQISSKIDDVQFSVLSKLKTTEGKFQTKLIQMEKNSNKLSNVFKKVQSFSQIIEHMKDEVEENSKIFTKKIQEGVKKSNDHLDEQLMKLAKESLKQEKGAQRKFAAVYQKIDKIEDFFLQKIQFMKMEIQSQMSNKTSKILEQKTKNDKSVSSETLDQINSKLNKFQLQTNKQVSKIQSSLKEAVSEVRRTTQKMIDQVNNRIDEVSSNSNQGNGGPRTEGTSISSQKMNQINNQFTAIKEEMKGVTTRVVALQQGKQPLQRKVGEVLKKVEDTFIQLQQKLNGRVEKVMFLVTKMRGDSIIRNQFNDKEIKQMKKNNIEMRERIQTTWKLLPGLGECVNLMLALIYDAEYQHSRIIQDNLPTLPKDTQKFNTCCEGVLYQFKEKKKPGSICYRHTDVKKTDLVRATFNGYIQIWEQIYEADLKNKQHLLPKGFYKRVVQKLLKGKVATEKQISQQKPSTINQMRSSGMISEGYRNSQSSSQINSSSFHIRKRKTMVVMKDKDDGSFDKDRIVQ